MITLYTIAILHIIPSDAKANPSHFREILGVCGIIDSLLGNGVRELYLLRASLRYSLHLLYI